MNNDHSMPGNAAPTSEAGSGDYEGKRKSNQQIGRGKTPLLPYALELGFFAGLFWGLLRWLLFALHFTIVDPGFLAEPFFKHSFIRSTPGHLVGLLFFIALSLVASVLYIFMLRRWKGPFPGIAYGILWWIVIFVLVGPKVGMLRPLNHLTWNSIYTEICVFVLWGLFIGYTIAVEYTDERIREPEQAINS